jgi:hypothetical protein
MSVEAISCYVDEFFYGCFFAVGLVVFYIIYVCASARQDVKKTNRTEFFTCDKHGAFPTKYLMEIDLADGNPAVKQCPFCYEEAFKKADSRLKEQEKIHDRK